MADKYSSIFDTSKQQGVSNKEAVCHPSDNSSLWERVLCIVILVGCAAFLSSFLYGQPPLYRSRAHLCYALESFKHKDVCITWDLHAIHVRGLERRAAKNSLDHSGLDDAELYRDVYGRFYVHSNTSFCRVDVVHSSSNKHVNGESLTLSHSLDGMCLVHTPTNRLSPILESCIFSAMAGAECVLDDLSFDSVNMDWLQLLTYCTLMEDPTAAQRLVAKSASTALSVVRRVSLHRGHYAMINHSFYAIPERYATRLGELRVSNTGIHEVSYNIGNKLITLGLKHTSDEDFELYVKMPSWSQWTDADDQLWYMLKSSQK